MRPVAGRAGRGAEAAERHVSVGMDVVGLVLLAKWQRALVAASSVDVENPGLLNLLSKNTSLINVIA